MPDTIPKGPEPKKVRTLFAYIANRYDFANSLMSFGQDYFWRKTGISMLKLRPAEHLLDMAAGSGALSKEAKKQCPQINITAADFCIPLLQRTPKLVANRVGADALLLPFNTAKFDAFCIAYGMRNFSNIQTGMAELSRVLKPGGRGLILEFLRPKNNIIGWLYKTYLNIWIPLVGGLVSGNFGAYRHLTETIQGFMTRDGFKTMLENHGLKVIRIKELSFGASTAFLVQRLEEI